MTKTLILTSSYGSYVKFLHQLDISRTEYRYVTEWMDVCGHDFNTPVLLIEGYEYNRNYTLEFMRLIGYRFTNIGFLTERELWHE